MLRLDTVPRLEIGSEGDPRFQFDRIVGAGRLENGEILIVDRGSKSLRWYSGSGEFKREAGGTGYGPEDFQDPVAAYVVEGDRVFVYDGRLRRLSEWSGNGHVKNSWTMQPTANGHVLNPVGLIGTDFILSAWIVPSESQYVAGSLLRDTLHYYSIDLRAGGNNVAANRMRWLFDLPSAYRYANRLGRVWAASEVPFSPQSLVAFSSSEIFATSTDKLAIQVFDPTGNAKESFRYAIAQNKVGARDVAGMLELRIRNARDEAGRRLEQEGLRSFLNRLYAEMPIPSTKPAIDRMLVDALGLLWVRAYSQPSDVVPSTSWYVFTSAGALMATFNMDARTEIVRVGTDHVLAVHTDHLDVERIQEFGLTRGRAHSR
jgi:hypothetical protein